MTRVHWTRVYRVPPTRAMTKPLAIPPGPRTCDKKSGTPITRGDGPTKEAVAKELRGRVRGRALTLLS